MISPLPCSNNHAIVLAGADTSPALRTNHDSDSDRVMDPDEQRDYADQGPPSDSDLCFFISHSDAGSANQGTWLAGR